MGTAVKYGISNWIYGDEPIEETFARLNRYGYDGIELRSEPAIYEVSQIRSLCQRFGLKVLSLAGIYPWPTQERDLAHPDAEVRRRAVEYLRASCDFAAEVGAPLLIVVPASVARTAPITHPGTEEAWVRAAEHEWDCAVDSVRQAARHAEARGILLAVEPINRYETFLVNTCEQAQRFIREVDSPAVRLHLDTFHMNIEEMDMGDAVRRAGSALANVHIADSNRQGVGRGHVDFRKLLQALQDIGYEGSLILEPLPPVPDPYIAARLSRYRPLWEDYARESIERLRSLEAEVDRRPAGES